MVTVIGRDQRHKKQAICRKCSSILEYWPSDVQEKTYTDYGGGRDRYFAIKCVCMASVEVPAPR